MDKESEAPAPEGYIRCIEAMEQAARQWVASHPFAELRFNAFEHDLARQAGKQVAPHEKVAVVASLSDVIERWAGNADTAAFLRAMDEASEGGATYMQARAIIDHAREAQLERATGDMIEGEWACTGCQRVNDGFTAMDGKGAPEAGSLSVCGYCGTMQQISADARHFEPLTTRELNALPKSVRVHLLAIKNGIDARIAREKARS